MCTSTVPHIKVIDATASLCNIIDHWTVGNVIQAIFTSFKGWGPTIPTCTHWVVLRTINKKCQFNFFTLYPRIWANQYATIVHSQHCKRHTTILHSMNKNTLKYDIANSSSKYNPYSLTFSGLCLKSMSCAPYLMSNLRSILFYEWKKNTFAVCCGSVVTLSVIMNEWTLAVHHGSLVV